MIPGQELYEKRIVIIAIGFENSIKLAGPSSFTFSSKFCCPVKMKVHRLDIKYGLNSECLRPLPFFFWVPQVLPNENEN
ncbi:hypothetical protein EUGRSUZ_B03501 [Eucalyptus grandis]|uniref:Uncharacterized protein n=2 Tax=Eucalyptus grandis TaxID=71139 RepID=A0ACC3LXD1_EUCGR|nr:hypothetical protein EUGRSUZ_B03501 [Eucalyptus grandis]